MRPTLWKTLWSLPVREEGVEIHGRTPRRPGAPGLFPCGKRGLKSLVNFQPTRKRLSLPVREEGVEIRIGRDGGGTTSSLPVREEGVEIPLLVSVSV